jgi:CheY-like chemotaxis protein
MAEILREAAGFAVSGKNTKCKFAITDDLWPALIDEGQMHQVIHYLVINAAESMPRGGVIEIGAQNLVLEAEQLPLPAGNYIRWSVRDHGVGIPKEHMKKLFDPYFTTKQMGSIKGMGLGLAICHSIIKNHEGLINIESEPGKGTMVTIYIPAIDAITGKDKSFRPTEAQDKIKNKVLLIDDEKILLDVTSSMLSHLGYEVTTAESHENALDIYCRAKNSGRSFSLIIMDLTMRGNEGGETAIRKWLAVDPEVKAIISSGYVNDPVIENYQEYGFVGAMVKPYTLSDLKKSMERILKPDNM